jgi:16S rRNA U516 pseudouridylate synthase RsuA-like enzyme
MFDLIGHTVIKLRRSRIGPLRDDALKPKKWRKLTADEVKLLTQKRSQIKAKPVNKTRAASHSSPRR